ncbi:hypothetical protein NPIL_676371 [Nephila pilipes]|uniref:Uncharacterized protein n=1 Tax=Nephila pilipes TaxID=299642 RepID=A0A8X6MRY0_NEPPI|nr:hypothetical protein NPIL_676371 [Nephila pilipes]
MLPAHLPSKRTIQDTMESETKVPIAGNVRLIIFQEVVVESSASSQGTILSYRLISLYPIFSWTLSLVDIQKICYSLTPDIMHVKTEPREEPTSTFDSEIEHLYGEDVKMEPTIPKEPEISLKKKKSAIPFITNNSFECVRERSKQFMIDATHSYVQKLLELRRNYNNCSIWKNCKLATVICLWLTYRPIPFASRHWIGIYGKRRNFESIFDRKLTGNSGSFQGRKHSGEDEKAPPEHVQIKSSVAGDSFGNRENFQRMRDSCYGFASIGHYPEFEPLPKIDFDCHQSIRVHLGDRKKWKCCTRSESTKTSSKISTKLEGLQENW